MSAQGTKTVVHAGGDHVGWFEDGTYYVGWENDLHHPAAFVADDGRVTANESGQTFLGRVEPNGDILDATYPGERVAMVTGAGELHDLAGVLLAQSVGPEPHKAVAAYALLAAREPRPEGLGPALGALAGLHAGGTHRTHADPARQETSPSQQDMASQRGKGGWQSGDPYPESLTPDPDGLGPRGLFGKGPKRAGAFRVGDRVEVSTLNFRGIGQVLDVSNAVERGFGTKLYPAFLVHFEPDGDRGWFNGIGT